MFSWIVANILIFYERHKKNYQRCGIKNPIEIFNTGWLDIELLLRYKSIYIVYFVCCNGKGKKKRKRSKKSARKIGGEKGKVNETWTCTNTSNE